MGTVERSLVLDTFKDAGDDIALIEGVGGRGVAELSSAWDEPFEPVRATPVVAPIQEVVPSDPRVLSALFTASYSYVAVTQPCGMGELFAPPDGWFNRGVPRGPISGGVSAGVVDVLAQLDRMG